MIKELIEDNLSELVRESRKTMVQFSAGWCGNCRIMKPKFKKLAAENTDVQFIIVDAEKFPQSRQLAKVDNLPTFAVYQDGALLNQVQTNKFEVLKTLLDEITDN